MALTPEQQASVDMAVAIEADRYNKQMALQAQQAKLEAVRIAQQTLLENRRNKPVDEREVTATDITNYASALTSYING